MRLEEIFKEKKPIIGMIHLAGKISKEKIERALYELNLYQEEGIDGAIIEDYHGSFIEVKEVLKKSQVGFENIVRGVNLLSNPYLSFELAKNYGGKFIQFDSVQTRDLNMQLYRQLRRDFLDIAVLGGVGFKYILPTGNPLKFDLDEGKLQCDAIVTTGEGTGIETPIDKLKQYKQLLGSFPLIVGAGVNLGNVRTQLMIADGAIIGSYFKYNGNTQLDVERDNVKNIIRIVKEIRKL